MAEIPLIYEAPIFVFLLLAVFTIYRVNKVRKYLPEGNLRRSYFWIVMAAIFFTLWGVDHVYHDLSGVAPELAMFLHYGVSHGFLLLAMICISLSATKIQDAYSFSKELRNTRKKVIKKK